MWNEVLEDLTVVKRSGQRVEFNASKIAIAIKKAFDNVYNNADEKMIYKVFEKVLNYINENYKDRKTINVEDIQDIIEKILNTEENKLVYQAFNDYRRKRAASRKVFTEKQQHKFVKAIEKVQEKNLNQVDAYLTPNQVINKFGRIISSEYTKSYILDNKYVRALEEGNIFIHNLDYFSLGTFSHLNLKINVKDDTLIDDIINEIKNIEFEVNSQLGINLIDYKLEEFVIKRYRQLLKNNLKKYLKVCGFLDFVNYKKCEEVINKINKIEDTVYSLDFIMINTNLKHVIGTVIEDSKEEIVEFINVLIEKLFNSLYFNYKKNLTYNISVGDNETLIAKNIKDAVINYLNNNSYLENINIIFKIYRDIEEAYLNKILSLIINQKNVSLLFLYDEDNKQLEYFNDGVRIFENINDNKSLSTGRMIVSSTSINLARLGLKFKDKNIDLFYSELDQITELAKNELLLSFESIGNKMRNNYSILFNGNIYEDEKLDGNQKIRKVIKNGVLNLGIIGLKECVLLLESDASKQYNLVLDILNYLNNKCKKFSEDNKINFSLFEPSDIKSRKFLMAIDKSIYGINKNVTDKDYYDLIEDLKCINNNYEHLSEVQRKLGGGSLITIKLPSSVTNKKLLDLIEKLQDSKIEFVKIKVGK